MRLTTINNNNCILTRKLKERRNLLLILIGSGLIAIPSIIIFTETFKKDLLVVVKHGNIFDGLNDIYYDEDKEKIRTDDDTKEEVLVLQNTKDDENSNHKFTITAAVVVDEKKQVQKEVQNNDKEPKVDWRGVGDSIPNHYISSQEQYQHPPVVEVEQEQEETLPSDNNKDHDSPPVLKAVIHIGPHKTATSTIQETSAKLVSTIAQDGYDMPWSHMDDTSELHMTVNQVQFATCFLNEQDVERRMYPCSKELLQSAQEIAKQNRSVLISAETFSAITEPINRGGLSKLSKFLTPLWENITIVLSYRHFYDWILSCHNEMTKIYGNWENSKDIFQANATDKLRPSVYDQLTNHEFMDRMEKRSFSQNFARYSKHFDNVVVMNFHDRTTDLVEQFYCHALPDAPNTCDAVKKMLSSSSSSSIVVNKGQPLYYEDIIYAAHRKGIVNIQTSEQYKQVQDAIKNYHKKTLKQSISDFQWKCPPQDVMDQIWNVSLKTDKMFFTAQSRGGSGGMEYTANHEKKLRDDFEVKTKTKTKSCELDTKLLLELPVWKEFFSSLELVEGGEDGDDDYYYDDYYYDD